MKIKNIIIATLLGVVLASAVVQAANNPVYDKTCSLCHATGIAGAPRFGNAEDWAPRIARGVSSLYTSALQGTAKGMPPKGGGAYSDAEVKGAVDFMVAKAGEAAKSAPATKTATATPSAPTASPAPEASSAPIAEAVAVQPLTGAAIPFNRLMKPKGKANLPPAEDGIHDPTNDGTLALLPPLQGLAGLPPSPSGNRVNWVEALNNKSIKPRYDRNDPTAEPIVMDLNIVREVKGSMPDVVYPHKQHTQWLDCSNCHPAIFVPQKGANQISMAAILLGQKCGVCHGKVAFPVAECRRCHSKKKDIPLSTTATAP